MGTAYVIDRHQKQCRNDDDIEGNDKADDHVDHVDHDEGDCVDLLS